MPRGGRRSAPRAASPRPSADRRTMAPPPQSRVAAPPPQQRSHAPPPGAQTAPPAAAAQGPGLMGQMAATAGGVAIGSVVGHGISNAIWGGSSEKQPETYQDQMPQQQMPYQQPYSNQQQNPCSFEMEQFITCTQNQSDITVCQGFNQALKECKARYAQYSMQSP